MEYYIWVMVVTLCVRLCICVVAKTINVPPKNELKLEALCVTCLPLWRSLRMGRMDEN